MKTKKLTGGKIYWVAQNRAHISDAHAFRTRAEAVHFIDHRVEGWDVGNTGHGWALFQCSAFAEHRP